MQRVLPRIELRLLNDVQTGGSAADMNALRAALMALPGFGDVTLKPDGRLTVRASVPARNQQERDRLKALVNERLHGWRVIEEQGYGLPATF